jgi:flavin reductase (DIM6/NTAB) family NADH-FMN oxidoreductase RutF
MKIKCDMNKFYNMAFPMSTVLVTCSDEKGNTNIITIAWHTTISKNPPLYGISVAPGRFSYDLIKKSKEFVINFSSFDILEKIHFCGTNSGKKIDKIKEAKLTLIDSEKIKTPSIQQCYAHFECKLNDTIRLGDHDLFVGEVVNAKVDEEILENGTINNKKIRPCLYLGNNIYSKLDENREKF